jgi:hypothetical protein
MDSALGKIVKILPAFVLLAWLFLLIYLVPTLNGNNEDVAVIFFGLFSVVSIINLYMSYRLSKTQPVLATCSALLTVAAMSVMFMSQR